MKTVGSQYLRSHKTKFWSRSPVWGLLGNSLFFWSSCAPKQVYRICIECNKATRDDCYFVCDNLNPKINIKLTYHFRKFVKLLLWIQDAMPSSHINFLITWLELQQLVSFYHLVCCNFLMQHSCKSNHLNLLVCMRL